MSRLQQRDDLFCPEWRQRAEAAIYLTTGTRGAAAIITGPNYEEEATLVANIDLNDIVRARFDFDAVGHYSRSDVFQLRVDCRPNRAVRTDSTDILPREQQDSRLGDSGCFSVE